METIEMPMTAEKMTDAGLVKFGGTIRGLLLEIDARHRAAIEEINAKRTAEAQEFEAIWKAIVAEIERRTLAKYDEAAINSGTTEKMLELDVPGFACGVKIVREYVKDIPMLRTLEGKIAPEKFAKAVYQEKPKEPEWKANATQLNALLKEHDETTEIGKIIRAALSYKEKSRSVFLVPNNTSSATNQEGA